MRPRLNHRLAAKLVGVVQIAVGGMHCAALTHDNKILTWGVNDQGALGRKTEPAPLADIDEEEDENDPDADSGLNASEAEPRDVDLSHFPEGTKFSQVVAADSSTFVVTTTGLVYGWGTFRVCLMFLPCYSPANFHRATKTFLVSGTAVPRFSGLQCSFPS
jgi:regulator of chromosome condensation